MRRVLLYAILVCCVAAAVRPDALLDRAAASERSGDLEASASVLAQWISANPGAAGSPEVLDSYFRVEQDFPRLLQTAAEFLQKAKGVPGAGARFERIARLYDLCGRIEEARNAYLAAHAEGAPDSTLVSAFLLSLQMNDAESMSAALEGLKGRSPSSEILLQSLSDLRTGDRAAARAALVGLAEQTGNPDLALKSLWVLYKAAQGAGDTAGQLDARTKMGRRFASAPETVLAGGASGTGSQAGRQVVLPAPAPNALTPAAPPAPSPATPATPAPTAPNAAPEVPGQPQPSSPVPPTPPAQAPATPSAPAAMVRYSVQAGSFQMKENADDLLLELGKRGFSASVLHDQAQGRDRWRVFAGTGLEQDAAEAVRLKLSAAGFTGFLVRDK